MRTMFAVKVAGHTYRSADIYWRQPGSKRRALFDSRPEAAELADREAGYVVEVRVPSPKGHRSRRHRK